VSEVMVTGGTDPTTNISVYKASRGADGSTATDPGNGLEDLRTVLV